MFLTSISKCHSSWHLSGALQLNIGCFKFRPLILGAVCIGFALLIKFSASLTAIIAALVAAIAVCIMACDMLCSDAITFCFLMILHYVSALSLFSSLPYM